MNPEIWAYLAKKQKHSYTDYFSRNFNSTCDTDSPERENYIIPSKDKEYPLKLKSSFKKYLSVSLTKCLLSIIFLLLSIILIKSNQDIKNFYAEEVLTKQLNFTKFNNLYNKYLGDILPDYTIPEPTKTVINTSFSYSNGTSYLNGEKIETEENYIIPTITSGIIVFLGNKESLGPTCIIQGVDGVDIWYSNINIDNLNLYDYIDANSPLGPVLSNYMYLTIDNNGTYISYEAYKS